MKIPTPKSASNSRRAHFLWNGLPRGLALFLGGFSLLNLVGSFRSARFDANLWWIDLRAFPPSVANGFLLLSALCLIGYAFWPPRSSWRRTLTIGCAGLLAVVSLSETVVFYELLARQTIRPGLPIPLSLVVGGALAFIVIRLLRSPSARTDRKECLQAIAVCAFGILAFPLAQMFCFGKTDYRRPADIAVVFGARVYADGRPSDAVADRVRTACRLYHDGWTRKLLLSGGPGDGPIHETKSMKRMALQLGVKEQDVLIDEAGLNTQATVRNSEAIFARLHASRVLVVSHFYHLPRIKLAYQRAGWDVYTVPAKETYVLRQTPYNIAREVAALWVYYLRPLSS